jgi:hypothetical protein
MQISTLRWEPMTGWVGPEPDTLRDHDGPSTLVLVFGSSDVADLRDPFDELLDAFPSSAIIGASTAGHVLGTDIVSDGLLVTVVRFASARLTVVDSLLGDDADSYGAGLELGRRLSAADPDLALVLAFADGVELDGAALADGLDDSLSDGVVVSGGLAADDDRFVRTWVLAGEDRGSRRAVAVGVSGSGLRVHASDHAGWDAFGPDRRITRSVDSTLFALDDTPALTLYRNYLGALAVGLPATALLFPLAVRSDEGDDDDYLVRMVLATDDGTKSLRFAATVPEGGFAWMMRADFEHLIGAAQIAAEAATTDPEAPTLALAVSCIGRRLVLGDRTPDELEAALDGLPTGSHLVGLYAYGQLAPRAGQRCRLHNQTIAITTIQEIS